MTRFDYHALVSLHPLGSAELLMGMSSNVGAGGMLLQAPVPVNPGTLARFATAKFAGKCEAVWYHASGDGAYRVGIRFTVLDKGSKASLDHILLDRARA